MSDIKIRIPLDEVLELARLLLELDYRGKASQLLEHAMDALAAKPEPQLFGVAAGPVAQQPPGPPAQAPAQSSQAESCSAARAADDLRRSAALVVGSRAEITWWHVGGKACPRCGGKRGHWHLGFADIEKFSDFDVQVPRWALCPVARCDRPRGHEHHHTQLRWGDDRMLTPLLAGGSPAVDNSGLVVRWEHAAGGGQIMAAKECLAGLPHDQIFTLFVGVGGFCPVHDCMELENQHRHDGLSFAQRPYLRERLEALLKP